MAVPTSEGSFQRSYKKQLDGRPLSRFERTMSWRLALQYAHRAATSPCLSRYSVARLQHFERVLNAALKMMESLEGEELQAYTSNYGVSKAELRVALERLKASYPASAAAHADKRTLQQHSKAAYSALCAAQDAKSRKAAKSRILPLRAN